MADRALEFAASIRGVESGAILQVIEGRGPAVYLLPFNPSRIIHGLLEARRFRPVGSRPLFLLDDSLSEGDGGPEFY